MGTRGRKPTAELATSNVTKLDQRPPAPAELNPEESQVWEDTVSSLQADWFRGETLPLLTQYCRHVVEARFLTGRLAILRNAETFDDRQYAGLLRSRVAETKAITTLATKLRITPQATYDKTKVKRSGDRRPWES
jgi:hypothetical protein